MDVETYLRTEKAIFYCEILVASDGDIILARPSHTEALITLAKLSRETLWNLIPTFASPIHWLVERYSAAAIWYESGIFPLNYTSAQVETINRLIKAKQISSNFESSIATEYSYTLGIQANSSTSYLQALFSNKHMAELDLAKLLITI